jgi:hypothetical protein
MTMKAYDDWDRLPTVSFIIILLLHAQEIKSRAEAEAEAEKTRLNFVRGSKDRQKEGIGI